MLFFFFYLEKELVSSCRKILSLNFILRERILHAAYRTVRFISSLILLCATAAFYQPHSTADLSSGFYAENLPVLLPGAFLLSGHKNTFCHCEGFNLYFFCWYSRSSIARWKRPATFFSCASRSFSSWERTEVIAS